MSAAGAGHNGNARAAIRAERVALLGLDRRRVAVVTIVTDEQWPAVIMFGGDPFLLDFSLVNLLEQDAGLTYAQARPYRADCMVVEDLRC